MVVHIHMTGVLIGSSNSEQMGHCTKHYFEHKQRSLNVVHSHVNPSRISATHAQHITMLIVTHQINGTAVERTFEQSNGIAYSP